MSKFIIEIETDNAAFEDDNLSYEVGRVLWELSNHLKEVGDFEKKKLFDYNGNHIGFAQFVKD